MCTRKEYEETFECADNYIGFEYPITQGNLELKLQSLEAMGSNRDKNFVWLYAQCEAMRKLLSFENGDAKNNLYFQQIEIEWIDQKLLMYAIG